MLCQQQFYIIGGENVSTCNQDIRALAKDRGVKLWEIAEVIGVSDGNFSRRLRRELSPAEKQRIVKIIDRVAARHAEQSTATAAQ